jgi:hypothetical protein
MLLINVETGFVGIGIIKPERDERIHDLLDKTLIDCVTISLLFDKAKNSAGQFGMLLLYRNKQIILPLYQSKLWKKPIQSSPLKGYSRRKAYGVHRINPFSPLISFSLHPVAIEVSKEAVDIIGARGIAVPFAGIVPQKCFILKGVGFLKSSLIKKNNVFNVDCKLTSRRVFKCVTKYRMRLLYKSEPIKFAPAVRRIIESIWQESV